MNLRKKLFKKVIIVICIVLILMAVATIILKYHVEGETNMPFKLSKIMMISTAEGMQKEESEYRWDADIFQINDVYIEISKNKNYDKTEVIDKVIIDDIQIIKEPLRGNVKIYRTSEIERNVYKNKEKYLLQDTIEYTGAEKTSNENTSIANQGGLITLKIVNEELGNYQSNEEEEIKYDGTILNKINVTAEEIKTKIRFNLTIQLKSEKSYKGEIEIELPYGDITKEGISYWEKTDFKDVVFKRQ